MIDIKTILRYTGLFRLKDGAVVKTQEDIIREFCETIGKQNAIKLAQAKDSVYALLDSTLVGMALSRKEMTAEELYKQSLNLLKGINNHLKK